MVTVNASSAVLWGIAVSVNKRKTIKILQVSFFNLISVYLSVFTVLTQELSHISLY